jgi:hypothetical protein
MCTPAEESLLLPANNEDVNSKPRPENCLEVVFALGICLAILLNSAKKTDFDLFQCHYPSATFFSRFYQTETRESYSDNAM